MSKSVREIDMVQLDKESADQPGKTYKTDKTIKVSNEEFLETIFGNYEQDTQPVLVSFSGDPHPKRQDRRAWKGQDRRRALVARYLHPENNNYFSLSTFRADKNGFFERKKESFASLYAVMLDDVGTKAPLEGLNLEPSALIETSPGNHQAIYILKVPETDIDTVERLVDAIIAAGLCDKGANGPTARLARLPEAINGKHTPPFHCVLKHWNPDKRYTIDELVAGLNLQYFWNQKASKNAKKDKAPRPETGDPIYIPVLDDNPVLKALKDRGLFKTPLGDGKYDITCPWVHEHTGGQDGGTCYFEPDTQRPRGGFHCFHGHCESRNIKTLLEYLGVDPKATRQKPTIKADPGELDKVVDIAEQELARSGRYYQRGNTISIVTTSPENRETTVAEIKAPTIRVALSNVAHWEKYNATSQQYVPIDPPGPYATALFDMPTYKHLPVLKGLARQPYLRGDGSVMQVPGYDPESFMFGVFNAREYNIPENPTKEQAQEALALLSGLIEEFSFKEEVDKSAAICAMLTSAIRVSLPKAPMFHVRAPQIGSGKSYLNEIIAAFCTPHSVAPTTFPEDEEECKKVLLAALLTSPAIINFDNLTVDLIPFPSLCAVITEEYFSARILGYSKQASVSTRTLFLSSGNNVGPVQDMGRRTITINLDAKCEVPAAKEFKNPDPRGDLLRERGKYVAAALTIIRAWIIAGKPKVHCKPLASFREWTELCCQSLMWLGLPDPRTSAFAAMNDDPGRETLERLMIFWHEKFGKRPVMARDLIEESYSNIELRELLEDIAPGKRESICRKSLGWWLKRHEMKVIGGLRIVPDGAKRSSKAWRLDMVS